MLPINEAFKTKGSILTIIIFYVKYKHNVNVIFTVYHALKRS
jgi:hypothetical protein